MIKAAALVVAVGCLAGCGSATSDATRAALDFKRALDADDGRTACALLAPRTLTEVEESTGSPCATGILDEDVPTSARATRTDRHGSQSRVVLDDDVVFLSRFSSGWRVVAAACTDRGPDLPYDCTVKGD